MNKKLLLISTPKSNKHLFNFIKSIHPCTAITHIPHFVPFDNTDKIEYMHKKHNITLSLTNHKNMLTFTRTHNNSIIDTFEFALNFKEDSNFSALDIDINPIYFTIMQGVTDRLQNVLTDFFTFRCKKVAVDGVKYLLFIKQNNKDISIQFEDLSGNIVGPCIELVEKRVWVCENDVWKSIVSVSGEKKIKNVSINGMKDLVGTLHMERQDLREIQIKKPRRVKNKE